MKPPKYSVIIPTLNEEKFLPLLLTSLVNQTQKNFEVIVVDGRSKDKTVTVAKKFAHKLPLTIIAEETGVSRQRNSGATHTNAPWLVFVDADSVLLPEFFEKIERYIRDTHTRFFTTWLRSDGDDPGDAIAGFLLNMGIEGGVLIERPWAPGPMTIVRRDIFESIGGFNESVTYGEDHELGVSIFQHGVRFDVLREILYVHSFRRYRKEGNFKVFMRGIKSSIHVIFRNKGLAYMPGFIGGGSIYNMERQKDKKVKLFFKLLESRINKFIQDLQTL